MSIEIRNVGKSFGAFQALDDVSLDIATGELVALLGPSGCGKTTLLRIIAGLEQADTGAVAFQGEDATRLDVRARRVGFVFQHYALFRHMTVFDNVAFGLKVRPRSSRLSKAAIAERVHRLLELVQLDFMADRLPNQLSGGQRQRVALARALAVEPRVLLLDEPFGALDAQVRKDLRRWLRRLHDELHVTSVFVTHDQEEAMEVSDRVVVMNRGRIEQVGPPASIYDDPVSPFVYEFVGQVNALRGRIVDGRAEVAGVRLPAPSFRGLDPLEAVAYIRPHEIALADAPGQTEDWIAVTVTDCTIAGPVLRIEARVAATGERLEIEMPRGGASLAPGPGARLYARPTNPRLFADTTANPTGRDR
ncbi:MAG: sulfate ABC transporter ATP-binding protein [Pseudomonadales bacterium]|nr:sulfate ABC transporter ATP-binding protein [Pseudomonadales bacterium]